jgi:hypothetical protein
MKMVICSIRDSAADAYGRPFFLPSVGVAIRSFTDEVNRASEDNQIYQHPEDFDLFELGEFDDANGKFALLDVPKQLALGRMVKVRE